MSLRSRMKQLERTYCQGGRCPQCRGRPATVIVSACSVIIPDNGRDSSAPRPERPHEASDGEMSPCPGCGWQPTVIQVNIVVIESPQEENKQLASRGT
jgi:hypothetical protein